MIGQSRTDGVCFVSWARMSKSSHVGRGEEDPIHPGVKKVTQAKPAQGRSRTELFLERARKRVEGCCQDVEKETARSIEASFSQRRMVGDRLRVVRQEELGGVQENPRHDSSQFRTGVP